jgi:hypothetical protein
VQNYERFEPIRPSAVLSSYLWGKRAKMTSFELNNANRAARDLIWDEYLSGLALLMNMIANRAGLLQDEV